MSYHGPKNGRNDTPAGPLGDSAPQKKTQQRCAIGHPGWRVIADVAEIKPRVVRATRSVMTRKQSASLRRFHFHAAACAGGPE
jgi:hypothetical protein